MTLWGRRRRGRIGASRPPGDLSHYTFPVWPKSALEREIEELRRKAEELRDELRRHEYLYYGLDAPELSDAEFDALMNRLKALEAEHPELVTADSPTQRVGGKPKEGFVKTAHSRPMLSLDNAYNEDELRAEGRRVRGGPAFSVSALRFVCEPEAGWVVARAGRSEPSGQGVVLARWSDAA